MSSSGKPFTTVTLEDGTFAMVRIDPRKPQFLEVIALFLDASRSIICRDGKRPIRRRAGRID